MDTDNNNDNNKSLRSRPPQSSTVVKENMAKIDTELVRCRRRLEDLKLMRSLEEGGEGHREPERSRIIS
jgi:hypothetical protein